MNEVSMDEVWAEFGEKGRKEIFLLTWFLFAGRAGRKPLFPKEKKPDWLKHFPDQARYASSVVIRSEVELLGVSTPRFGFRLYFGGSRNSFINCRRLTTLNDQVMQTVSGAGLLPRIDGPCIADLFIMRPAFLPAEKYHFITVPLAGEYGEPQLDDKSGDTGGTPHVEPSSIGGGLCAQACCYVATAILQRHTKVICGLGEITAMASPAKDEISILGLDENEIAKYFEAVGLRSIYQFGVPAQRWEREKKYRDRDFRIALEGYGLSNMPVILGVNSQRLMGGVQGPSIYESNGVPIASNHGSESQEDAAQGLPPHHAVVVVGCSRRPQFWERSRGSVETTFLIHDPNTMPVLQGTLAELAQIGVSASASGNWEADVPKTMRHPTLLPVTPSAVRMPLLCWGYVDSKPDPKWNPGLIQISAFHRQPELPADHRQFFLAQIGKINPVLILAHFVRAEDQDEAGKLLEAEAMASWGKENFGWSASHWVWLECCPPGRIKVWDAELSSGDFPIDPEDAGHYLRGIISHRDGSVVLQTFALPEGKVLIEESCSEIPAAQPTPLAALKPALISSFDVNGGASNFPEWPEEAEAVEVYASMRQDLPRLFPDYVAEARNASHLTPVAAFARAFEDVRAGGDAARQFAERLGAMHRGRQIIGLATFMPEILAKAATPGENARKGLQFLIEAAAEMKTLGLVKPNQVFVIELVAGSRIHGIVDARGTQLAPCLSAKRLEVPAAIRLFLDRLEPVAHRAQANGIELSIELEPGPLFVLNDTLALWEMCRQIEDERAGGAIPHVLGFNFDLPHWGFLAGVPLGWLSGSESLPGLPKDSGARVRRRILHAHASDHGKGHFCDNVFGAHHTSAEFLIWLRFLAWMAAEKRPSDTPGFSGYVSCEMEACKSLPLVSKAYGMLTRFLQSIHP